MPVVARDFAGQFVLCQSESQLPETWMVRCHRAWRLAVHATLPVMEIVGDRGSKLGWLLGYPVAPGGKLISAVGQLSTVPETGTDPAAFERWLYGLGGRFAAIYLATGASRAYLDAGGTLGLVYAPEESVVASTTNLIPHSERTREDTELARIIGVPSRDRWYPFGLTPRRGIERLLPNHFLDLTTWRPRRHWPTAADLAVHADVRSGAVEVAALMENTITAVAGPHPTYMGLTAGRHTRMMLACARRLSTQIAFFTIPLPEPQAILDCAVAERIARRFGLQHETLRWEEPTSADIQDWLYRTGACVAGRTLRTVRTLRELDPHRCLLSGALGAVGEAVWWNYRYDLKRGYLSPPELLARAGMPPIPELLTRAGQWLAHLPSEHPFTILDFLHFEQRLGAWVGPQEYGHVDSRFVVSPFSHRRIIQLKLTLPIEYRRRDRLPTDLLKIRWPELLEVPFNGDTTMRRALMLSREVGGYMRSLATRLSAAFCPRR